MEILTGLEALPAPRLRTPIVTWGVFDGVHLGHRRLLETAVGWARRRGVSSAAVTFIRPPAEILSGRPVPLLASLEDRLRLIGELGIEFVLVLEFSPVLARQSAETFVREIVAGRLHASGVVLGHDARFGREREGDLEVLRRLGVETIFVEPVEVGGRPVSSSAIREAVAAGRVEEAARLLGRPFAMRGTVHRGDRRGARLGFPTANLGLGGELRPSRGVYAVEVRLGDASWRGVADLGERPTFGNGKEERLEVHLLDYPGGDLYGRSLEVRFIARLRDERQFPNEGALQEQIRRDVAAARRLGP